MSVLNGWLVRQLLRVDCWTAGHAAAACLLRGAVAMLRGAFGTHVLLQCLLRRLLVEQMAVAMPWCPAAMLEGTAAGLHWSQVAHVVQHRPMLPLRLRWSRAMQMLLGLLHSVLPILPVPLDWHAGTLLALLPLQSWLSMGPEGGHLHALRMSWQWVHGCLSSAPEWKF